MNSRANLYRYRGTNPRAIQFGSRPLQVDASTLALWLFNEKTGNLAFDKSTNGLALTLTGSPTWVTSGGPTGASLSFDGIDDYGARTPSIVSSLTNFTIEAVVRSSVASFAGEDPIYVEADPYVRLRLGRINNQAMFGWFTSAWEDFYSAHAVPWTSWNYIAATSSSRVRTLYVNGLADGSSTASANPPSCTQVYVCRYYESGYFGTFELATLRLSNIARSAAEILVNARQMGFAL